MSQEAIEQKEYDELKGHAETCPHCLKLAQVLFIRIKEHKENLEK